MNESGPDQAKPKLSEPPETVKSTPPTGFPQREGTTTEEIVSGVDSSIVLVNTDEQPAESETDNITSPAHRLVGFETVEPLDQR